MSTLSIPSDYFARLTTKVRGLQAQEGEVDPQSGSNPTDDKMIDAVQSKRGDLSREEVRQEIRGLNDRQQAELVALLWLGRGDVDRGAWEATIETARSRRDIPTEDYLLGEPLVAEYWAEGMEKLAEPSPTARAR